MNSILIKNGRIIDPSQNIDAQGNLLIENGMIKGLCAMTMYRRRGDRRDGFHCQSRFY